MTAAASVVRCIMGAILVTAVSVPEAPAQFVGRVGFFGGPAPGFFGPRLGFVAPRTGFVGPAAGFSRSRPYLPPLYPGFVGSYAAPQEAVVALTPQVIASPLAVAAPVPEDRPPCRETTPEGVVVQRGVGCSHPHP